MLTPEVEDASVPNLKLSIVARHQWKLLMLLMTLLHHLKLSGVS
jgi:hypothetical protein